MTAAVRRLPVTPVERARTVEQSAAAALATEETALAAAREREAAAFAAYKRDEHLEDAAHRARLSRERLEGRVADAQHTLDEARAAREAAEQEVKRERYERLVSDLVAAPGRIAAYVPELARLRARACTIAEQVADVVVDAEAMHAEAAQLADELGVAIDFQRRAGRAPTIGDAALVVGVGLHRADVRSGREDVTAWLTAEPPPKWDSPEREAYEHAEAVVAQFDKGAKGT